MQQETDRTENAERRRPPQASRALSAIVVAVLLAGALALGVFGGPAIKQTIGSFFAPHGSPSQEGDMTMVAEHDHSDETGWFTCPMHPWITQRGEGLCPICHMDLVPIDPAKFSGEIAIDPAVLQNIGVRTAEVVSAPLELGIRTIGHVEYDETRVADVNLKLDSWIEKTYVEFEGASVERGQPLVELYSPELYAAQEEYLLLLRAGNEDLLAAAHTRLSLYDISPGQIEALEKSGVVSRTVTVAAPAGGVVIEKNVNPGMRVTPGTTLYRIADFGRVWVLADFYEFQLPYIAKGQRATVSLPYLPGKSFEAVVDYIYPYLDEKTRQVRVRLELRNRGGLLKPGMFADVELEQSAGGDAVLAPREAVLDTGARRVAIVKAGEGRFESRDVETGREAAGGMVEILSGLQPGDMVVVSGQFLLDSESRLRESLAKLTGAKNTPPDDALIAAEVEGLSGKAETGLGDALDAYLAMADALYSNETDGLPNLTAELRDGLQRVAGDNALQSGRTEIDSILAALDELGSHSDIHAIRAAFGRIGPELDSLLKTTGLPASHKGRVAGFLCGMFPDAPQGGVWLQAAGDAHNPFFGAQHGMRSCYTKTWEFPAIGGK